MCGRLSESSADSASKDYCVLVNHAYVDRVQQALGGRIVGDLEPSHQRLCSLRLATIGSSSPASLMAMGRKEVSRARIVLSRRGRLVWRSARFDQKCTTR